MKTRGRWLILAKPFPAGRTPAGLSFLITAKGLRIEGPQSLTGRWVLPSVPCGGLGIGRIKVNQSQQVLPWLSAGIAVELYPSQTAKTTLPCSSTCLLPVRGRETEARKRNRKHLPSLQQGTFPCSHKNTQPHTPGSCPCSGCHCLCQG